ncbi:hypothetical protein BIY26_08860 [Brenneria goodwinii]|uniref:Uncharacterized protein n=1 Tax=Brenneria goodwinii TaxID=1109412 RepID=A0AAE8EPP2_9GAMM|nr:hypothetical protein [Brenneria goodwinii]ATA26571.1 hypothetical protein AWC36_22075 [Brenneria goodwinii]RLM25369.1 hypothetical protein BIY26_08860 [Brenneria goodwinii]
MTIKYEIEGSTLFCFITEDNGLMFQGDMDISGFGVVQVEAAKNDALAKAELTKKNWYEGNENEQ